MATMPAVASAFDMLLATFFYFFCGSEDGGAVMATTPPCLGEFEFFLTVMAKMGGWIGAKLLPAASASCSAQHFSFSVVLTKMAG